MNWAVGARMEAVCDTIGLSGGIKSGVRGLQGSLLRYL